MIDFASIEKTISVGVSAILGIAHTYGRLLRSPRHAALEALPTSPGLFLTIGAVTAASTWPALPAVTSYAIFAGFSQAARLSAIDVLLNIAVFSTTAIAWIGVGAVFVAMGFSWLGAPLLAAGAQSRPRLKRALSYSAGAALINVGLCSAALCALSLASLRDEPWAANWLMTGLQGLLSLLLVLPWLAIYSLFRDTGRHRIVRHPIGALCLALIPAACIAGVLWTTFDTEAPPLRSLEEASCSSDATKIRIGIRKTPAESDNVDDPFDIDLSLRLAVVPNKASLVASRLDASIALTPIDFFDLLFEGDEIVPALPTQVTSWQAGQNPIANLKKDEAFWLELDTKATTEWIEYLRLDDFSRLHLGTMTASGDVVRDRRPRARFLIKLKSSSPLRTQPIWLVCQADRLSVTYTAAFVEVLRQASASEAAKPN